MLKVYDTASNAFVEKTPKIYDATAGAWIEAPSLKTFDTTENAWIERLYQGFFTLRRDSYSPVLLADDEFIVTPNEITLFTAKIAQRRFIAFELPFKWAGETVEFDLTSNGIAFVYFGKAFYYGSGGSISGYDKAITEFYGDHVTVPLGTRPDEYEGQAITSSKMYFEISVSQANAEKDIGYVNISNLKINGKKYGFKE